MLNILERVIAFLLYNVNWGPVCYLFATVSGILSISSFDATSDWWWAYFLGFATISIILVALGYRESARYWSRVQQQRERDYETIQRRNKLRNEARKALREHEEIMAKKTHTSQM